MFFNNIKKRNSSCLEILLKASLIEKKKDSKTFQIFIDAQEDEGNTALHKASDSGDFKCIKMLIESGASLSIRNKNNYLPSDLSSDPECTQYFTIKMLDLDQRLLSLGSNEESEEMENANNEKDFFSNKFQNTKNSSKKKKNDSKLLNSDHLQSIEQIIERVVSLSENSQKENFSENENEKTNFENKNLFSPNFSVSDQNSINGDSDIESDGESEIFNQNENLKSYNNNNGKKKKSEISKNNFVNINNNNYNNHYNNNDFNDPPSTLKKGGKERLIYDFQLKAAQESIIIMEEDLESQKLKCLDLEKKLQSQIEENNQLKNFVESKISFF